jgi:hypothetical protein
MAKKKGESTKKTKYKVGLVFAIRLPNGRFAYAKVFNDLDLGIYDFLSDKIEPLERVVRRKFSFFTSAASAVVKAFPVVGEQPFQDEEAAWAPPMASGVWPGLPLEDGVLHIDHKGERRRATPKEAAGLDIRGFSQRQDQLVNKVFDRLVEGNHAMYRIKP